MKLETDVQRKALPVTCACKQTGSAIRGAAPVQSRRKARGRRDHKEVRKAMMSHGEKSACEAEGGRGGRGGRRDRKEAKKDTMSHGRKPGERIVM